MTADRNGTAQVLEQAAENYFAALNTGVKLQQEMSNWWIGQCAKFNSPEGWSKPLQESVEEAVKQSQQNYREALALMERNAADALALLAKTGDLSQIGTLEEGRKKLEGLWDASLDAVRKNAQLAVDANARLLQAYSEFVKKNTASRASATATK